MNFSGSKYAVAGLTTHLFSDHQLSSPLEPGVPGGAGGEEA